MLKDRKVGELKYYDGETHEGIFFVPKYHSGWLHSYQGHHFGRQTLNVPIYWGREEDLINARLRRPR